ncbi:hypothetical protein X551_02579 [Methylibium sp. T29]|nr:hypothetical protein X551_02579 [Methylibium sp. T29]
MLREREPRPHRRVVAGAEHPGCPQARQAFDEPRQTRGAAAEHDDVRVEQVDHRRQRPRHAQRMAVEAGLAGRIAGQGALADRHASMAGPPWRRWSAATAGPLSQASMHPAVPQ